MYKNISITFVLFCLLMFPSVVTYGQINTEEVTYQGRTKLYFGDYVQAINKFNLVIQLKPHLPEPYYYRGVAKMSLEDYRGSIQDLSEAIDIKPYYPEAFMYRGMAYYSVSEFQLALEDLTESLRLDDSNSDLYNNRGICYAAMQDFEHAIEDYSMGIELKPKNYNAYLNRSIAYQVLKEYDKAIEDCNNMIRIKPRSAQGYMSRGLIKIEKKDFAGSLRDFDMAVYVDPQSSFAYMNRGLIKHQLADYESAIMDYSKAIEHNQQMASAYFNRAVAKQAAGRTDYQYDYDVAYTLDSRFAQKPWQTEEERQRDFQKQLSAYRKGQHQSGYKMSNITPDTNGNDASNPAPQTAAADSIDFDELRRRKMKANLIVEDNRKMRDIDRTGRVQNKNVEIELLPIFSIGFFMRDIDENTGYYNGLVEDLNQMTEFDPYLTITNRKEIPAHKISYHQEMVWTLTERIIDGENQEENYLLRSIFLSKLNKFQQAKKDINHVLANDPQNILANFCKANILFEEIEYVKEVLPSQDIVSLNGNQSILSNAELRSQSESFDYSEVLRSLDQVIEIDPKFSFVYFNKGNVACMQENYSEAQKQFTIMIETVPNFAEAYFNRGLVRILLNDIDGGAQDLSKAGELGIVDSYNIIKRYCN